MTPQQFMDEYTALPPEAQREVADFVAFLRQRYQLAQPATQVAPPEHPADLEQEPFIGMWRKRQDLLDSTAWVRSTRQTEWGQES